MGQIAEDMQDGTCCELCGQYFGKKRELFTHGYPVVCKDCWKELSEDEKEHHQRAEANTL